jgi:DMSO/TMAO reductase YedYZ molybdopterin-dependent catalytic subunit/glyoxylase-like metal-dependent hydrolase (beta-lactamase superfamily II)
VILKQFYLGCLAHASYLVADEACGAAAVVDPQRDVDEYVAQAHRLGCRIGHVFLTHFHADFVAGHLELRDLEGARIYLGARAEADYDFTALGDHESVQLGQVRLEVLETPGHSPESISILVYDQTKDAEHPYAVLSGDTLFIGDVGRPDLRASLGWSAEELGGLLYDSLQTKLLPLPDETLLYPAHGAGSLCGKNLSTDTVSTIGVQRRYNYALQPMGREEFVSVVTAELPDTPAYFTYDALLNTKERPTLGQALEAELQPLSLEQVLELAAGNAQLLDVREPADFAGAHLVGSVNVGLGGSYATWAGTLLEGDQPIAIVADPGREQEAAMRLGRIGFDSVAGYLEQGMQALDLRPELVARIERITAATLAEQLEGAEPPLVVDVRTEREWREQRISGSLNIPLTRLQERVDEVPRDRQVVVHCATGYRSSIAASVLKRHGFDNISDLVGGISAWLAATTDQSPVRPQPRGRPQAAQASAKHPSLVVWTDEPLNAETPLELLCEATITPTDLFYVRNHGPVPAVDPSAYRLTVNGLAGEQLTLSLDDLRGQFAPATVKAALTCAGNRRSELTAIAAIPGQVPWGPGATGNAIWSGVRLRDVLGVAGLDSEQGHVAFSGLDQVEEEGELLEFGGSIPLERALRADVLLADEMNGEPLPALHGYPLRVVVPGYIGARSVKWVSSITVQSEPSTNYFQARTYRLFPSHVRSETSTSERGFALGALPVNCAICHPLDGQALPGPRVRVRGYALTGGARRIERVELSLDGGKTFHNTQLLDDREAGTWCLWEAELEVEPGPHELLARAWDSAASTQPQHPTQLWNLKGYMNNAWHQITFTALSRNATVAEEH